MVGRRATIHEVARAAGVSISSVSRVLNGNTSSADMIARVRAAVDEVDYVPSAVAQSLKTQHTGQVAFAVEDIGNPAYLAMVRAIQPVLRAAGYRLLLHSTGADVEDELEVVAGLGQRYVDGLVLCPIRVTPHHLDALADTPVPVVVIGSLPDGVAVDNVRADSPAGCLLAVEHLHARGARRIAFVNGPADTVPGSARLRGYREALESVGLPFDEDLVEMAEDFQHDAGVEATRRLVDRIGAGELDALFGANDLLALAGMNVLRERGRSIPDDVRVIGMDDTTLATTAYPALSSVGLASAERGVTAAELLLTRLRGEGGVPERVVLPPALTIRESSR